MILFKSFIANANVESLSFSDRKKIEFFLKEFYLKDGLGYVVFFDTKPISLTCFFEKKNRPLFPHFVANVVENVHDFYFKQCWLTWKKNQHLFRHPKFIFAEDETLFKDGERARNIYIVNKIALSKCLAENEAIFRAILGNDFSINNFIQRVESEKQILPLINYDDCLFGILLGYGYESSLAFKNNEKSDPVSIQAPLGSNIWPVGFMGNDECEETKKLIEIYKEETEDLWSIYKSTNNFLELILEKLAL